MKKNVLSSLSRCANVEKFNYQTLSGPLHATRVEDGALELDFPADDVAPVDDPTERKTLEEKAIKSIQGKGRVVGVYRGRLDTVVELEMDSGVVLADVDVDVNALV
jgi:hypothetical protein